MFCGDLRRDRGHYDVIVMESEWDDVGYNERVHRISLLYLKKESIL